MFLKMENYASEKKTSRLIYTDINFLYLWVSIEQLSIFEPPISSLDWFSDLEACQTGLCNSGMTNL